eukprot:gene19718-26409_t
MNWVGSFTSSKRQELQTIFTAYSASLNEFQENFNAAKEKLAKKIEEENIQAQDLANIKELLQSMNAKEIKGALGALKTEMDGLISVYKTNVLSNNALAAQVYDMYANGGTELTDIQALVTSMNVDVKGIMNKMEEKDNVVAAAPALPITLPITLPPVVPNIPQSLFNLSTFFAK